MTTPPPDPASPPEAPVSHAGPELRRPIEVLAAGVANATPQSITDFLTDGSLVKLCDELSQITGAKIEVRDPQGRAVVLTGSAPGWSLIPRHDSPESAPLVVAGVNIGSITIGPATPSDAPPPPETNRATLVRSAVGHLASAVAELCGDELELRHKAKEVGALARLASMLVRAPSVDRILHAALESAIDVLGLDAGSIMLLPQDADGMTSENEADLTLATSINLSREWLEWPTPLSKDRLFDRLALAGEVVTSENLQADPRVGIPERVALEGLVSCIHTGLVFQGRPIGVMRLYARRERKFDESDLRLFRSIAQQSAVAVQQSRLLKSQEEERRIQRQLQLAADVQRRMMPRGVPNMPAFDVAAKYLPSFELGGDFYDFVNLNGHLGLVIGDVVGKGVAAALLMAAVRASLRAHVQDLYDLDEVIARVNQALCRDTHDQEFATLWYGVIDPTTMRMTYCSAGHEPTFVVRVPDHRAPGPEDIDELSVGGMVVGIDPSQRYQRGMFDLRERDVIVAYTDGMCDAVDFSNKKFTKRRLHQAVLNALAQNKDATAAQIIERVFWEIRQFAGLTRRPDDQTLVVVRVREGARRVR